MDFPVTYNLKSFRMTRKESYRSVLRIVSSNVRGFGANIAELTHNVIIKKDADIVFVCKTFLDDRVPRNHTRIQGYST